MNAKVSFQLSEQLIPFYSATDALNAYMLASETATHLKTLANQISKNTIFVKSYAVENKADASLFTELESLIAITHQLANDQADTYKLEFSRHMHKPNDQYDAGDLFNIYSLTYENTSWLQTLFYQIKDEIKIVKDAAKQNIHSAVFCSLDNLIHIAEYLADNYSNTLDVEREKYEMEWNKIGRDQND